LGRLKFRIEGALLCACLIWPLAAEAAHLIDPDGLGGQQFGASVSELGDQNSDNRWEFLVGSPLYSIGGADRGRVYIWFGNTELTLSANWTYAGQPTEQLGFSVASIGDVNDDGVDDYAAGAPYANNAGAEAGRVYVFFGGTPLPSTPDLILEGPAPGGRFGWSVSAAGDFNRDGRADLIVGAPYFSQAGAEKGAAYIYYGGSSIGPDPDLSLVGQIAGDHFGWSVTDCGNFTGTSNECVAIGAPQNTQAGIDAGAAYVFEGGTSPDTGYEHKFTNSGVAPNSLYGFAVRGLGAWYTTGHHDLAIGAPTDNSNGTAAGRIEVFFGGSSAGPTADRYVNGQYGGNYFGFSLADAENLAGSSRPDLVIGAPQHNGDGILAGRAYFYRGGSSSYNSAASLPDIIYAEGLEPGSLPNDRFGYAVSGAGDFDGDGIWDFAIGARDGNSAGNVTAGYVRMYDTSGTVVATFFRGWEAAWTGDGAVALSVEFTAAPAEVTWLTVVRSVLDSGGEILATATLYEGEPPMPATGGPVTWDAGTWQVEDLQAAAAGMAAGGARLAYSIVFALIDGAPQSIGPLSGPSLTLPATALRPQLQAPWPNPCNPAANVRFRAPAGRPVNCSVFDARGRRVAELYRGPATGAWQTVRWNGQSSAGTAVATGLYLVRLVADGQTTTQRLVITR